ncbi:MAG: M16 family metallopeptidase [Thermodesulfobacteriota bacterium]
MRLRQIGLYCAGFVCLAVLAACAPKGSQPPSHTQLEFPQEITLPQRDIQTVRLDNGVTCLLLEDHELPLVKLTVQMRNGEVNVPQGKEGLADIAAQAVRNGGSETYPGDTLDRLLEDKAAQMDVAFSRVSGRASLNVLQEDFDALLPVFTDVLLRPRFPQEKIELAKTKLKTRISRRNDQQRDIALREFKKLVYGEKSVYARVPEYETVDAVTRQDVREFYAPGLRGENMLVSVVGDFETEDMAEALRQAFGDVDPGQRQEFADLPRVEPESESAITCIHKSGVNQSFIILGHTGVTRTNPDYPALQVMNKILSGGFSGRLFEQIRTKRGLAYSVFGRVGSRYFYPGLFYIGLKTESARTKEAIVAVQEEIARLQEEGVSGEELRQAKDQFLNSLVFRYDSADKIMERRRHYEYRDMPGDSFEMLMEDIEAVDAAEVQRVAREYIRPDALQILVVGDKDAVSEQLESLGPVQTRELD